MPPSTLGVLWTWAAAGGHENFCTEAMVAAVRGDLVDETERYRPSPLMAALRSVVEPDAPSRFRPATPVIRSATIRGVETQVQVGRGFGILDVLLELDKGELWIEVKTGSPEGAAEAPGDSMRPLSAAETASLSQLELYEKRAQQLSGMDGRPRAVVLLSPTRLRPDVPWLPWAAVRRAVLEQPAASRPWQDLTRFLEDTNVVDDRHDPVRASEAASLGPAAALLRKVVDIVWEVQRQEIEPRGYAITKHRGYLLSNVATSLKSGELVAYSDTGLEGPLTWGVAEHGGEAWWVLRVRDRKLGGDLTRGLRDLWDRSSQLADAGWTWGEGTQYVLVKTARVVSMEEPSAVLAWYHDAFAQLEAAGVLAVLKPPMRQSS